MVNGVQHGEKGIIYFVLFEKIKDLKRHQNISYLLLTLTARGTTLVIRI